MESLEITSFKASSFTTPYHSGQPIDSIVTESLSSTDRDTFISNISHWAALIGWRIQLDLTFLQQCRS
jgi:hypothetical protein